MSTSAIIGRIYFLQDTLANLNANIRSNSMVFDLDNNNILYSPSGTGYFTFYPGQSLLNVSSTSLNVISASPRIVDVELPATGVVSGSYGTTTQIPQIFVDSFGRIVSASVVTISGGPGTSGIVTSIGLTSNSLSVSNSPITTSGTISVNLSPVGTSGIYTKVSTDSYGRIVSGTTLTSGDIPGLPYLSAIPTLNYGSVSSVGVSSTTLTIGSSPITTSGNVSVNLSATGVTPGSYGTTTQIPVLNIDSYGRILNASYVNISGAGSSGTGTVTSVGLTSTTLSIGGSPVTSSGVLTANLSPFGTSGIYTKISSDPYGRVISGTTLTSGDIPNLSYLATSSINSVIYQSLYLVSAVTSSTVSATSANLISFSYGLIPNIVAFCVSGTSGSSATSYTATYNIYSGINSTLSNIASGTISNSLPIDSASIINIFGVTSFAADLTVSGTLSGAKIFIIAKSA